MLIYAKMPNSNGSDRKLREQITQVEQPTNMKTMDEDRRQALGKECFSPQLGDPHSSKLFCALLQLSLVEWIK